MIRKVAALLIALAVLYGCGKSRNTEKLPSPRSADTLVYSDIDEPKRLDPVFIKDLYEGRISGMIHDGLVNFGKGADVEPGLAAKWEVSPDGKTYTFHLREAKFANGQPVTSGDVRYSFTRVLRPETNSDRKWVLNRI